MKKFIIALFCCVFAVINCATAATHTIDKRQYADWSAPKFQKFVRLGSKCTGQFVAPNIILTAAHCIRNDMDGCQFTHNYKDEYFCSEVLIASDKAKDTKQDWALLLVKSPSFYSKNYFRVLSRSSEDAVQQAGFGALKILSDEEIRAIREKFLNFAKINETERELLKSNDSGKEESVLNRHKYDEAAISELISFLEKEAAKPKSEGGLGISKLFGEEKLKYNAECFAFETNGIVVSHNCSTYSGDSGSALWIGENLLNGVHMMGHRNAIILGLQSLAQEAVDTNQFYDELQDAIYENPVKKDNE